jgi:hypothetical protein
MLSDASPKTGWSPQQMKEPLTTPLPRIQMGMYLFARVIFVIVVTERHPCFPAILLILHLAEPMCATVIHPFIAQVRHCSKSVHYAP